MDFPIPDGWTKGELLNVKNMGDEFHVSPLFERVDGKKYEPIKFYHADEAQTFVGWWYLRETGG